MAAYFRGDAAADTGNAKKRKATVLTQPLELDGKVFKDEAEGKASGLILNFRRLDELVTHMVQSPEMKDAAVTELCSMEYIASKFESHRGHDLLVTFRPDSSPLAPAPTLACTRLPAGGR